MADSGLSTEKRLDLSLRTRPRSTSEAIRRRINQRLASTSNSFDPPELIQTSYSAQSTSSKPELRIPSTLSQNYESHSLKRKKTSKADKKVPDPSFEASTYSRRKGRSVSRRIHSRHDSEQVNESSDDEPTLSRSIAAAELDRLSQEVDSLKEALHESKRANKRQTKKYDEARAELHSTVQALKDKESELVSLKERYTKREELVSTIESSVQCQICMDLPDRPFALAPCGHVLCLACLQEWFRKAPPTLDDMDIDPEELTDPRYVLTRSKSCPTCRAVVKHKPVPVFMVRAIAGALRKIKSSNRFPILDSGSSEDPWKGIFPSSEEDDGTSDDGNSSAEESVSDSDFQVQIRSVPSHFRSRAVRRAMFRAIYSSNLSDEDEDTEDQSESDHDDQIYVHPRWAPPSVNVDPAEVDISEEQDPVSTFKLLQRGCTWEMIQCHDLTYGHSSGIILSLRSLDHLYASDNEEDEPEPEDMHRIFLGWNITLDDVDLDGEVFICSVIEDIKRSPFRWEVIPRIGVPGAFDARKLVPASDVVDFETTDTDAATFSDLRHEQEDESGSDEDDFVESGADQPARATSRRVYTAADFAHLPDDLFLF